MGADTFEGGVGRRAYMHWPGSNDRPAPGRWPEVLLVCACVVPLVAADRSIPTPEAAPFDIHTMAVFISDVANGRPLLWVRDPYLRYVPQTGLLEVGSWLGLVEPTVAGALTVAGWYTILHEGVLIPVLLYWVGAVYTRLAGLVAVAGLAAHRPVAYLLDVGPPVGAWFYSTQWHYVLAVPPLLVALGTLARLPESGRGRRRGLVVVGLALGVAGSVQTILGLLTAAVVAVVFAVQREWRGLAGVAGLSALVASPNALVIRRYGDVWFQQAVTKARPDQALTLGRAWMLLVLVAAGSVALATTLRVRRGRTRTGLRASVESALSTRPKRVLVAWVGVGVAAAALALSFSGLWYFRLAGYHAKFGLLCWLGVFVSALVRTR